MTVTQTRPQFLTEALVEVLNNQWKVDAIESIRSVYTQLEIEQGRKYIKVWSYLVNDCFALNERLRVFGCSLTRTPNVTPASTDLPNMSAILSHS